MKDIAWKVSQLMVNYDKTPVLWDLSFEVPEGCVAGLIGPNGAGKSTLIKTTMGMLKPISGKIECFGRPFDDVRGRVAYVPQKESVDWTFPITVLELVLMGRYGKLGLFRRPSKADKDSALRYLSEVGMEKYSKRHISQLSSGQQQRVFIARALLQEADLYFMDEPFSGVDAATERVIVDLLHSLKEKGKTIVIVHHDLNSVRSYFDWLIMLNTCLVGYGVVDDVFTEELITRTYGKTGVIFSEAVKLSKDQASGIV